MKRTNYNIATNISHPIMAYTINPRKKVSKIYHLSKLTILQRQDNTASFKAYLNCCIPNTIIRVAHSTTVACSEIFTIKVKISRGPRKRRKYSNWNYNLTLSYYKKYWWVVSYPYMNDTGKDGIYTYSSIIITTTGRSKINSKLTLTNVSFFTQHEHVIV